jgi:hypothetical protein
MVKAFAELLLFELALLELGLNRCLATLNYAIGEFFNLRFF